MPKPLVLLSSVFCLLSPVSCLPSSAATRIRDTVYTAIDGARFSGQLTVAAPSMTTADGRTVARWQQTFTVSNGVVSLDLEPNDTAAPAGTSYLVLYRAKTGLGWSEYWVVPTSSAALKVNQVRTLTVAVPSALIQLQQLGQGGASTGQVIGWNGTSWAPANQGAYKAADLTDLRAARTSAAVLTLTPSDTAIGCGNVVYVLTAPATVTLASGAGTGLVRLYFDCQAGQLRVRAQDLDYTKITCNAQCSVDPVSGWQWNVFPSRSVPLWTWTATDDAWTIGGGVDLRSFLRSPTHIAAGEGLTSVDLGDVIIIGVDPGSVPRYGKGSGAPAYNCTAGRDFYTRTDTAHLYACTAANVWTDVTGSGGAPSGWVDGGTIVTTDRQVGIGTLSPVLPLDIDSSASLTLARFLSRVGGHAAIQVHGYYGGSLYLGSWGGGFGSRLVSNALNNTLSFDVYNSGGAPNIEFTSDYSDSLLKIGRTPAGGGVAETNVVRHRGIAYAGLASLSPVNGDVVYCSDCKNLTDDGTGTFDSPAASGGHGTLVCYENGQWRVK